METKPYDIAERLRNEEERAMYVQAISIETGGDAQALEEALIVVERSRAIPRWSQAQIDEVNKQADIIASYMQKQKPRSVDE